MKRPSPKAPQRRTAAIVPRAVFATIVGASVVPACVSLTGCASAANPDVVDTGTSDRQQFSVAQQAEAGAPDTPFAVAMPIDSGAPDAPFSVAMRMDAGGPDGMFSVTVPLDSGSGERDVPFAVAMPIDS